MNLYWGGEGCGEKKKGGGGGGGGGGVHTLLWWGNIGERDHLDDPGVDGMLLWERRLQKSCGRAWTGLIWLREGTSGGVLRTRLWHLMLFILCSYNQYTVQHKHFMHSHFMLFILCSYNQYTVQHKHFMVNQLMHVDCQLLHVGLYIFVILTPWRWHLGAETCRSWYMSYMVYHRVHILDDTEWAKSSYTVSIQ